MRKGHIQLGAGEKRAIAHSLDAPAAAFSVLEAFFEPLTALGSVPRRMVHWLRLAGIGKNSKILDLGCGKGAVSIAASRALGCRVVGIDAFPSFVDSCRNLADSRGVGQRCDFRVCSVDDAPKAQFDAVLMLNVLPYEQALPIVRRATRPGGIYIFDDAVRVRDSDSARGFPSAIEVAEAIESSGDAVERFRVWTAAEVRRRDSAHFELLKKHATTLMRKHPASAPILRECLRRQREGIRALTGDVRPACWLARRSAR